MVTTSVPREDITFSTLSGLSGRLRSHQRCGFGTLGEQLRGKPLRFGDSFHFDRDGIDGLLQLFKLQILRITGLDVLWLR